MVWPLLRPWSQSSSEHRKPLEIKGFLGLERPFLDLVSQTSRPRARGRPLFADNLKARRKSPNPNFFVRISSGGVGFFYVKGWGPKRSVCPSKPREIKLFGRISRDFAWDVAGVPEKFKKTKFVFDSHPLLLHFAKSKALTAIRTVFGLAIRIVRFEIAANWWRFESLRPRTAIEII